MWDEVFCVLQVASRDDIVPFALVLGKQTQPSFGPSLIEADVVLLLLLLLFWHSDKDRGRTTFVQKGELVGQEQGGREEPYPWVDAVSSSSCSCVHN